MGVTGNWNVDRLISIAVADFIGGLSVGWWVDVSRNHSQSLPFLINTFRTTMFIIVRCLIPLFFLADTLFLQW